jgi:hypothetical protein
MLLRRIIEHLRTQNWLAIALDLVVVVVGVFLAFRPKPDIRLESAKRAANDPNVSPMRRKARASND